MRYLTLLVTTVSLLVGGVPQNLSYQGFIKASDGTLLPDGSYTVTFRIYEEVTGGVSLWSEEHEIYLKSGMVSATLGESTSFTFSTKMNYLEIQVNGDVMTPRQKMTSVTYAFHAESAQKIATDSTTYTFPMEDGTSGQSLTTDGSGSLSWTTVEGGSSSSTSLSATGDATGPGVLKLYEDTDDGTNYAGLKAGTMSSDVTWTLPTADGTSGQSITTDGLGTLSWSSVSGGSLSNATTTIGTGAADAKLASSGEHNLTLQTGNATTGTITITDGANGNIAITPNGTGEVDISKVDIDGGAIDGTAIGASSASTGAFSTVTASGAVTANANLSVKNGGTGAGTVSFYEDSDDGTNYAGLKAGTMASDVTWTLPTADGTSGQVISTDGSGTLSWSSVSGGSLSNATTTIGTGAATANLASDGDYDLVLKTGNSTTGSITITDGANGNITVTPNGTGQVDIGTDLTVTGNDITFGNGETISNATDGDFLFTTGTASGALTLKNSNGSDGIAAIELVSDAGAEVGDAYEMKSLNGSFTITSDHSTKGTYDDTYFTISGNATPASSTTTIAGVIAIPDGSAGSPSITNTGDTDTGIYFSAADKVAVSTGGTDRKSVV